MKAQPGSPRKWIAFYLSVLMVISLLATTGCTPLSSLRQGRSDNRGNTQVGFESPLTDNHNLDLTAPTTTSLNSFEFVPTELAPTFTEKPFWIVLGLVVLGWIVLAADIPDE
jgi:hypothetical protein